MNSLDEWSISLTDDVELPGWFLLPGRAYDNDDDKWVDEVCRNLRPISVSPAWDGEIAGDDEVRRILRLGIQERRKSDSLAMFQVWPVLWPIATYCHLNIVPSGSIPNPSTFDGFVQTAESRYLGDGLQYSTRRWGKFDESEIELIAVNFIFDDGEVALLISLEEGIAQVNSYAAMSMAVLKDYLAVTRSDGKSLRGRRHKGVVLEEEWAL